MQDECFRLFVESIQDYALFMLDPQGRVLSWNPGAERLFGYQAQEIIGKPLSVLYGAEDKQRHKPAHELRMAVRAGRFEDESERVRKDGSRFWVNAVTTALKDDNGCLHGFARVTRDITGRKQAEAAIRQSQELYRGLVELSTYGIFIQCGGRIEFVNSALVKLLGATAPSELMGRQVLEFIHPDFQQIAGQRIRQLLEEKQAVELLEEKFVRLDGSSIDVEVVASPFVFHGQPAAQVIVHDISQRKQTEEALREAESKYRCLVEKSLVGVYIIQEGRFSYVNPRFAEIFGYSQAEILSCQSVLDLVAPIDRERVAGHLRQRLEGETQSLRYSFAGARRDGQEIRVEVYGIRADYRGRPAVIGTLLDVSEKSQLEEQLRQSQKMEAVGRLAGGIAHDFNNLLTAILGYSDFVLQGLEDSHPLRQDVEEIQKAGQRAASLTSQLLAFSRKQILDPRVLDLNQVVSDMDKMLRRVIGEDIELVTLFGPELGRVKVDPSQIEQIIMNLAVNSRDAMPHGGKLTIETANIELDAAYSRRHATVTPGAYVMLAISDTGSGMDAETQSRIFEPFFTTKGRGQGTGLGLSTVYGIVKQSGGNIWVYSEVGQGTVFKIYFPRVNQDTEVTRPAASVPVEALRGSETILLVEDEAAVRNLVREVLGKNGYTVLEAHHGGEALRLAMQHAGPIHLLLTDVVVPQLSGRQLAERLATFRPETRVLYMSGYTDNAIVHHGVLDAGIAFLQKPFTPETLLRKLRFLLAS